MPTTIEEEIEYEDKKTIIFSILFLLGLILSVGCCVYCIIKKGELEEKEKRRYNKTSVIQIEHV